MISPKVSFGWATGSGVVATSDVRRSAAWCGAGWAPRRRVRWCCRQSKEREYQHDGICGGELHVPWTGTAFPGAQLRDTERATDVEEIAEKFLGEGGGEYGLSAARDARVCQAEKVDRAPTRAESIWLSLDATWS